MGTFTIHSTPNGGPHKVGGNVVAYFLTPDLEVVHVVFGNADPATFLEGAKWTVDLADKLSKSDTKSRAGIAAEAHRLRSAQFSNERNMKAPRFRAVWTQAVTRPIMNQNPGYYYPVHEKLAGRGLPKLNTVYKYFFEKVLGENLSNEPIVRMNSTFVWPTPLNSASQGLVNDLR